jgi:uncharacterized damage-inducible protein DinB
MLGKDDVRRLLDYGVWANHKLMRAAATLGTDDFKRELGGSHGGVRGTLTHIMGAEWIWLERWKGVSPARGIDEGEFQNVLQLRERWKAIEAHRAAWFESLRERQLVEIVRYKTLDGRGFGAPLWQLVQHVVNHGSYHRGTLVHMLRQLGAKPVSTDLLFYDREKGAPKMSRRKKA